MLFTLSIYFLFSPNTSARAADTTSLVCLVNPGIEFNVRPLVRGEENFLGVSIVWLALVPGRVAILCTIY